MEGPNSSSGRQHDPTGPGADYEDLLVRIIRRDAQAMRMLRAVRHLDPPNWVIGAGVFRTIVWDNFHGYITPTPLRDVDVAYFDPQDLRATREREFEHGLRNILPEVPWEVKNQAGVHLWYGRRFGQEVEPLRSIEDAVGTWPETCTSVAIRLLDTDELEVIAPLELHDLLEMIHRRNPRRVSEQLFMKRLRDKHIIETWPKVRVVYE